MVPKHEAGHEVIGLMTLKNGLMWKTGGSLREVQKTGITGGTWHVYLLHKKTCEKEEDARI